MLELIPIALASICNAVMDTSVHHFSISIFNNKTGKNKKFWDGKTSWKNKYINGDKNQGRIKWNILGIKFNKPVQLTDSFHLFKTLMIIFLCLAIAISDPSKTFWGKTLDILIYGTTWNMTFSLFYNKILIKKNKSIMNNKNKYTPVKKGTKVKVTDNLCNHRYKIGAKITVSKDSKGTTVEFEEEGGVMSSREFVIIQNISFAKFFLTYDRIGIAILLLLFELIPFLGGFEGQPYWALGWSLLFFVALTIWLIYTVKKWKELTK